MNVVARGQDEASPRAQNPNVVLDFGPDLRGVSEEKSLLVVHSPVEGEAVPEIAFQGRGAHAGQSPLDGIQDLDHDPDQVGNHPADSPVRMTEHERSVLADEIRHALHAGEEIGPDMPERKQERALPPQVLGHIA